MSLARVVDDVIVRLGAAGISATDRAPSDAGELPLTAVSVAEAERPQIGIGSVPQGPQRGALPVLQEVDLASPTLTVGSETIDVLDGARTTLIVANGPLVAADGSEGPPFGPEDVAVAGPGAAWTITNSAPTGREFQVDPDAGTIRFGQPLELTGTLTVSTHVGVWEVTTSRYRGTLHLDVYSSATDSGTIARSVAVALETLPTGFTNLVPNAWGSATPTPIATTTQQVRRLTYAFVYERISPIVPTGGGVIGSVDVTSDTDGVTEPFSIPIPA